MQVNKMEKGKRIKRGREEQKIAQQLLKNTEKKKNQKMIKKRGQEERCPVVRKRNKAPRN